jgi:hypothetical protein
VKLGGNGSFEWGRTWGSALEDSDETDRVFGLSAGYPGHVYAVGSFWGTCDFDPGSGEQTYTPNGYCDAFLSAFTSSGEFQWARAWGGNLYDVAFSTAASSSGDVYVVGTFVNTVDFDPGPGVDEHTSDYAGDFLSRFDSQGNFISAGTWGFAENCHVALDEFGNALVAGRYDWTTDFDPGPGVEERTPIQYSGYDAYLSKFSPQCEFQWVEVWGGDGDTFTGDYAYGVACGPSGVAYVTGEFDGTCDFDPGPGVDERANPKSAPIHAFLTKFGPDGSY